MWLEMKKKGKYNECISIYSCVYSNYKIRKRNLETSSEKWYIYRKKNLNYNRVIDLYEL